MVEVLMEIKSHYFYSVIEKVSETKNVNKICVEENQWIMNPYGKEVS